MAVYRVQRLSVRQRPPEQFRSSAHPGILRQPARNRQCILPVALDGAGSEIALKGAKG